ncbi:MAG: hypothetical protein JO184_01780 [Gammaproteobacteria bacterium]|nr:hypothetical protein [Gammaproteobacteria bacterium]MBV8306698.1 hypothetical protein [Gammaproteobacteria bacterium]
MRKLMLFGAIGIAAYGVWHWRSTSPPSAQQIEPLLRDYLLTNSSENCSGSMTLEQLEDVSVGEFSTQFGGWPVYANHRETCHQGSSSMTYDGSKDVERRVAAVFLRRTATGRLETYLPALFGDAQRQMQQSFQKALDNVQTK